jgi:hypothetical protein
MNKEEVYVTNDFIVETGNKNVYGLFFRSPIQKVVYEHNDVSNYSPSSATKWLFWARILIIPYLLNFKSFSNKRDFIHNRRNAAGIIVNELAMPIYFRRNIRYMECCINNENINISKITSKGYGKYKSDDIGMCHKEITKLHFRNGKTKKIVRRETYYFTYTHIMKKVINDIDYYQ